MLSSVPETRRIPKVPATAWAYIAYLLRHCPRSTKWQGVATMLAQVGVNTCIVLETWCYGRIVGVLIASHPSMGNAIWKPIAFEMAIFAGIWTLRNVCLRIMEFFDRRYVPVLLDTSRELLFNRLIQQSHDFIQNSFVGVLAAHVRRGGDAIDSLRQNIQDMVLPLIVRFATAGVLLWQITPTLTLFVYCVVALCILAATSTAGRWTQLSVDNAQASSVLSGYIVDSVTNIRTVQNNVGWNEEKSRLMRAQQRNAQSYRARKIYASKFWGVFDILMTFFYLGYIGLMVHGWQTGDVTPAELAMAVSLMATLFGALAGTVRLLATKFDDIGNLQESLEKISMPISVIDQQGAKPLTVSNGEIALRDVSFSYPRGATVFSDLSLTIRAGEKVGLVGVSGAGKTTLCQLLMRAYDVSSGDISIDGQDIKTVTLDSLRQSIAIIPQDPMMFHRSIAENISYGRPGASPEEIAAAARAAGADTFIDSLPQGYQTLVGERGVKLSGGQRQRVAIAQAILKSAPILLLDEATSALDSETEAHIQSALAVAMQGRTTIAIAHRLSTLRQMDRIIVLDKGRVIEDGTFAELQKAGGLFAHLWNLQIGGFIPEIQ